MLLTRAANYIDNSDDIVEFIAEDNGGLMIYHYFITHTRDDMIIYCRVISEMPRHMSRALLTYHAAAMARHITRWRGIEAETVNSQRCTYNVQKDVPMPPAFNATAT